MSERVEVGRGDVNPHGIPVPNPHEAEGPDGEEFYCPFCEQLVLVTETWPETLHCPSCSTPLVESGSEPDPDAEHDRGR